MHEMGLAEAILSVVTDLAGERQVQRVLVRVGREQSVVADSLEFSFGLLAEGTVCEHAVLACVAVEGGVVLVDEVELSGHPPTILRRPGTEVVEAPHEHPHDHSHHDAEEASVATANTHGGS